MWLLVQLRLLCDPGCVETFCVQGGSVVTETAGLSCSPLPLSHLIAASCETLWTLYMLPVLFLQLGPLAPSSAPLLIILPLNSSSSVFPARLVTFLLRLWYWKFLPVPQIEIAQHCFKLESVRKWACPWKRGNITLLLWRRWIPLKRSYLISSDAKTHFKAQKILLWLLEKERSDMSWICFAKENWLKTYKAITIRPFSRENHSKQVTEMHKMLQLWEQMQVVVLYHRSRGPLSSSAVHCPERWCGGGCKKSTGWP